MRHILATVRTRRRGHWASASRGRGSLARPTPSSSMAPLSASGGRHFECKAVVPCPCCGSPMSAKAGWMFNRLRTGHGSERALLERSVGRPPAPTRRPRHRRQSPSKQNLKATLREFNVSKSFIKSDSRSEMYC